MAPRVTRGAAAKEAAKVSEAVKPLPKKEVQEPATNAPETRTSALKKTGPKKKNVKAAPAENSTPQEANLKSLEATAIPTANSVTETKKPASKKNTSQKNSKVSAPGEPTAPQIDPETQSEAIATPMNNANTSKKRKRAPAAKPKREVDPEELPHGMGKLWKPSTKETKNEDKVGSEVPAAISESKEDTVMKDEAHEDTDKSLLPPVDTQSDVNNVSQPKKPRTKKGNSKK
ncbi:MAG: hypothetical protein Q9174_002442, partial [Haloplaca sp. 1 TL-2023]